MVLNGSNEPGVYNIIIAYKQIVGLDMETGDEGTDNLFTGVKDLKADMHYYGDFGSKKVYLCSTQGNPGGRFESIEFNSQDDGIQFYGDNCLMDGIHLNISE